MPLATSHTFAQRYRTVSRLGSGGMATVFLAEDERLGRLVAVKRLHGESTEDVARRFRREARLGAALNHPNVVAVYDIVSDDEGVLIVMEYVEGQTLREEIADGRLEPARAIAILRGVARALDYAHENGVVHRDVKPANILVRGDGQVKLADLGIATAAEQSKITRSGAVLGTAAYMPPERLDGRPGGPATDVYALAAVAFEMLSGRKAYEGNTPLEVAHKVVNDPTPDLREAMPAAPAALAEALKRGLAWEPAERPGTAGELVDELEAALSERNGRGVGDISPDIRGKSSPGPGSPAPERSRKRPDAALLAAVLGVLVLLAIVIATTSGGADQAADEAGRSARKVVASAEAAPQRDSRAPEAPADRTPQAPAAPAPRDGGGNARPAAGGPAAAVEDFYERAARGDYAGAWALTTPRARAVLGGFQSFSAGQSSLESISFPRLKAKERGQAATVDLRSEAVHSDRVDRCTGSVDLIRSGGAWKLDDFHIARCAKSPRP